MLPWERGGRPAASLRARRQARIRQVALQYSASFRAARNAAPHTSHGVNRRWRIRRDLLICHRLADPLICDKGGVAQTSRVAASFAARIVCTPISSACSLGVNSP